MSCHQWSCSAIGQQSSGPFYKLLRSDSERNQTAVEWWSWGGQWGKGQIPVFSLRLSHSPGLGSAGELGVQGPGWGLCPAGLQSPPQGHPLAVAQALRSSEPCPHPSLFDPIAVAVYLYHSLWDLLCPPLGGLRSMTAGWIGCLTPSVMTAGQCVGTWAWGSHQLSSASS